MAVRVYFDTNIWISAMDTKDRNHDTAEKQFDQVRDGKLKLVVSKWVLLELIRFIIYEAMKDPTVRASKAPADIKAYSTKVFADYGKNLLRMKNVLLSDPDTKTSRTLNRAFELSKRIFGHATKESECPVCHKPFDKDFFDYHGPHQLDFIHALIARDLQCQKMLTFDPDFALLKGDSFIQPLSIEILNP